MPYRTKIKENDFLNINDYFAKINLNETGGKYSIGMYTEERDNFLYLTFYSDKGYNLRRLKKALPFKFWKVKNRKKAIIEELMNSRETAEA
jgi:hypothetical protein